MKKINPLAISIFIFLMAILVISIFTVKQRGSRSFAKDKSALASRLYGELTEVDFENSYPQTPEELMELNNKVLYLIYGNMLEDENLMGEVVDIHRKLLSKNLLALNPYENQLRKILFNVESLSESGISVISIESGAVKYYMSKEESAVAEATHYLSPNGSVTIEYRLIKEDGRWKINSWS